MKRILLGLFLICGFAHGAANDAAIEQRNAANNGWITRLMSSPPTNGLLMYNTVTLLPHWVTVSGGLSLSGTTLTSMEQADWTSNAGTSRILNRPTLATVATTGAYGDLTGAPTIPSAQVNSDWAAVSGIAQILNKPTLFSGSYGDLTGVPPTFPSSAHTHAASDIISGTLAVARIPSLPISQTTGLQTALDWKLSVPTGNTSQYLRGDGSVFTFPSIPAAQVNSDWNAVSGVAQILNKPTLTSGTVTSVTAGTGLSGGVITTSGTISLPNTGTAGTYANVTTDAQGRVTAGAGQSVNDAPGRTLVTSTSATGFQVSSTRLAQVCYEGTITTTSTIGGPASATVFLETADTNSTTPADWTTKAQQTYSNNITLAIVLNQIQINNWSFCRYVPSGKFVRIRSGSITGTASAAINATQQEVLQ